jgi:multiple sugar transport system permease protein
MVNPYRDTAREKMMLKKPDTEQISASQLPAAHQKASLQDLRLRRRMRWKEQSMAYLFLMPNIVGFLFFTLFTLIAAFGLSLFRWSLLTPPEFVGPSNYIELFTTDPMFHQILLNTLYFVFGYVPLNIIISLGIALWLSGPIHAKQIFRVIMFLPVMTPAVGVALVWMLMYDQSGIINEMLYALFHIRGPNWLGSSTWAMPAVILMSLWYGFGYNMLVFSAGLQAIPQHFYEAAAIDGARRWQRFWNITLPLLSPSLFFGIVLTLISSFQVFDQVYILTGGGPGADTTTLVLYTYQNGFTYFHMGYAATISTVLFILIMAVTLIQFVLQKKWVHYEV